MPKAWGRVSRAEMDVRPGGIFSIDIAVGDGPDSPNLGCFLDVVPMARLVWTSMLFPGYRPAVFADIPITAIVTMEAAGTGTRYVFTALRRCCCSGFFGRLWGDPETVSADSSPERGETRYLKFGLLRVSTSGSGTQVRLLIVCPLRFTPVTNGSFLRSMST